MSEPTETEAETIGQYAQQAVEPDVLQPGEVYAVADGSGKVRVIDTDEYADAPRRPKGHRKVLDAASFCAYLAKHGTPLSEVWANSPTSDIVAIIDTHEGAGKPAGWDKHKLTLDLVKSKPWLAWESIDGKLMDQVDFAEFVELRAIDIRVPTAADMLELAQHFTAKRSVDFESSEKIADGQVQLTYKENTTAKAGQTGHLDIPERLQLVLRPYVGGPSYYVWARFRYRLHGSVLKLGVVIERPQEILDAAFADIVTEIREGKPATTAAEATDASPSVLATPGHDGITQPIYFGRPE